jgi:hypothetical protein
VNRPPRVSLFLLVAVALVALLFSDAFVHGWVLSQADILFLHAPWSAHAPAAFTRPGNDLLSDIPQVFYPFLAQTAQSLRSGSLPLWTTNIYGGHPFLASYQTATFSLFTLPALVLPTAEALLAGAIIKLLVGGLTMWLFLRRLGLSAPAIWFGALAWLLNPFSVMWVEHPVANVSAWLPLLLWSVDRLLASRAARDLALLAIAVAIVVLAGHPETSYKVLLFCGAYGVVGLIANAREAGATWALRGREALVALLTRFAPAGVLGLALAAIQLVPFAEYLTQSFVWEYRREAAVNTSPAALESLATAVVPNFFGNPSKGFFLSIQNTHGVFSNFNEQMLYPGMAVWMLAAVGFVARREAWRARFFAASAVIAALLMFGAPGFVQLLMLVPGAGVVLLTRFGLVTIASAVVLGAYGVDALTRPVVDDARVRLWPSIGALALAVALIAVFLGWTWPRLADAGLLASTLSWCAAALVMGALAVAAIAGRRRGRLSPAAFATAAATLVVVDLFALGWRFHPMIPRAELFASTPEIDLVRADPGLFRVTGVEDALLPNAAMVYGLQELRGYDGMQPSVHGEVLGISHKGGAWRVIRPSETFHVLDLMNVKYIFARGDVQLPSPHFTRLAQNEAGPARGEGAAVFRNEQALPRAFLVGAVRVSTRAESLRLIRANQVDFRREAVLYEPLPATEQPEPATPGAEGSARVVHYQDTRVEIDTDAVGRRLLVFGDLDYPGWRATVDGAPVRIHRANRGLRGVALSPGRHRVVFTFEPMSVRIGAWLSLSALAVTGLLFSRRSKA